jgi:diguanylate cyclase (GGDEF)-like protein
VVYARIAAMTQLATEQQWKDKYRELVRELEDKERAWSKLEAALRGAAGKLARPPSRGDAAVGRDGSPAHSASRDRRAGERLGAVPAQRRRRRRRSRESARRTAPRARGLSRAGARVQARLDTVADQLREFRRKEEKRHAEDERRAGELRSEVAKLKDRTAELTEICAAQETRLMIDSLTGTHSRYAYERRLDEEFQRWQRHSQPLAFSIWDIDSFKRINDSFGHEAGDRLLRGVADLFVRSKRTEDFLARIGGEEFVLLLPMTTLEAAQSVAEKLRKTVETAAFHHHGQPVPGHKTTVDSPVTELASAANERSSNGRCSAGRGVAPVPPVIKS